MSPTNKTKNERLYCDPNFKKMFRAEAAMRGFPSTVEFSSFLSKKMKNKETTLKEMFSRNKKKDELFKM